MNRKKRDKLTRVSKIRRKKKRGMKIGKKCPICGTGKNITIHHSIPTSEGGEDKKSNYEFLCRRCHNREHKSPKKENKTNGAP